MVNGTVVTGDLARAVKNRTRQADVETWCPSAAPVSNLADSARAGKDGQPGRTHGITLSDRERPGRTHAQPPNSVLQQSLLPGRLEACRTASSVAFVMFWRMRGEVQQSRYCAPATTGMRAVCGTPGACRRMSGFLNWYGASCPPSSSTVWAGRHGCARRPPAGGSSACAACCPRRGVPEYAGGAGLAWWLPDVNGRQRADGRTDGGPVWPGHRGFCGCRLGAAGGCWLRAWCRHSASWPYMSRTMSVPGWAQQMSTCPSGGGSSGAGE